MPYPRRTSHDGIVIVDAARLEACTEKIIDPRGHLMLDLVPQTNQEPQVLNNLTLKGALYVVEAALQFPMLEAPFARAAPRRRAWEE